jgi:hypothetical protein
MLLVGYPERNAYIHEAVEKADGPQEAGCETRAYVIPLEHLINAKGSRGSEPGCQIDFPLS